MKINNITRKIDALIGTIIIAGTMSGCRINCDVKGEHSHLYKTSSGYSAYVDSEEECLYGFTKYGDYKSYVDPIDEYAFRNELLKIDDNIDIINDKIESDEDYNKYRLFKGEHRIHHMYKAYKIIKEDEKYQIIPSELVDDLNSIKNEYPYVKVNFTHLISLNNGEDLGTEGIEIKSPFSNKDTKVYQIKK